MFTGLAGICRGQAEDDCATANGLLLEVFKMLTKMIDG